VNIESDKYYLLKGEEIQMIAIMLEEMQMVIKNMIESKLSTIPEKDKNCRDTLIYHDLF
jgi:hypothetical protein